MRFLDELGEAIEAAAEREHRRLVRRRRTVQGVGVASIAAAGIGLVSLTGSGSTAVVDQPDLLPPPSATAPDTTVLEMPNTVPSDATVPPSGSLAQADVIGTPAIGDSIDSPTTSEPNLTGTAPAETAPPVGTSAPEATAPATTAVPPTTSPPTTPPTSEAPPVCAATVMASHEQLDSSQSGIVDWAPGITIEATNADGTPGSLSTRNNTVSVSGGRYPFQIDYLPPTTPGGSGSAERLTIRFASPTCGVLLGIRMLEEAEYEGLDESFMLLAFNRDGVQVEGRIYTASEAESDAGIRTFEYVFDDPAAAIALEPVPYDGGVAVDVGPNNSDFGLSELTATVLAAP